MAVLKIVSSIVDVGAYEKVSTALLRTVYALTELVKVDDASCVVSTIVVVVVGDKVDDASK